MGDTGESMSNPTVRICEINHQDVSCGFNLTKSKWDPYPWVSSVEEISPAAAAGVLPGDCLLEVNGEDMLGLRVAEVAARVRARADRVTVMLWNAGVDPSCTPETLCCGPMTTNLQRLTACMSTILEALECPICLDTIPPPAHQCVNGHLICSHCRARTEKCPVCRLRFFRGRSLLADQVFESLIEAFDLKRENEDDRPKLLYQRIYGPKKQRKPKPEIKINFLSPKNKFLTRIMGSGKSSSTENLATSAETQSLEDNTTGMKTKSLSSSEIFRSDLTQAPRPGSVLSSRPGSGLLDVCDAFSTRPASYHGSADDLRYQLISDFGLEMMTSREGYCLCPFTPKCMTRIPTSELKHHLREQHTKPVIQFYSSKATFNFNWLTDALVTMECYGNLFFINAEPGERIWIWTLDHTSAQYSASILMNGSKMHCSVVPLTDVSAKEISNQGIPLCNISKLDEELVVAISESSVVELI